MRNNAPTELEKLKANMRRVNWFLHFTRNSQKNRKNYYQQFKNIAETKSGKDWNALPGCITRPWEAAGHSFDQMYGLVIAWSKSAERFNELLEKDNGYPTKKELENLTSAINKTQEMISELNKSLEKIKNLKDGLENVADVTFEQTMKRMIKMAEIIKAMKGEQA